MEFCLSVDEILWVILAITSAVAGFSFGLVYQPLKLRSKYSATPLPPLGPPSVRVLPPPPGKNG